MRGRITKIYNYTGECFLVSLCNKPLIPQGKITIRGVAYRGIFGILKADKVDFQKEKSPTSSEVSLPNGRFIEFETSTFRKRYMTVKSDNRLTSICDNYCIPTNIGHVELKNKEGQIFINPCETSGNMGSFRQRLHGYILASLINDAIDNNRTDIKDTESTTGARGVAPIDQEKSADASLINEAIDNNRTDLKDIESTTEARGVAPIDQEQSSGGKAYRLILALKSWLEGQDAPGKLYGYILTLIMGYALVSRGLSFWGPRRAKPKDNH